jgi:putative flippase GtrA
METDSARVDTTPARTPGGGLAQLVRFGIVGVLTNGVYFGALWLLRVVALPWWLGATIAYALSMGLNYGLQRSFTFRSERPHSEAARRYLVIQLGGMAVNSSLLELLLGQRLIDAALGPALAERLLPLPALSGLPLRVLLAQGFALIITTSGSYVAQRFWVFRSPAQVMLPRQ